jgi:hypothetical protein
LAIKYLKVRVYEHGNINPNELKGWCFPNWYEKEHFETFMDRKLTDEQFETLKDYVSEDLMDHISNDVSEYLQENGEEILEENK